MHRYPVSRGSCFLDTAQGVFGLVLALLPHLGAFTLAKQPANPPGLTVSRQASLWVCPTLDVYCPNQHLEAGRILSSPYRECTQRLTVQATVFLSSLATALTFPCRLKTAVPSEVFYGCTFRAQMDGSFVQWCAEALTVLGFRPSQASGL
jgi:hypothetical protein